MQKDPKNIALRFNRLINNQDLDELSSLMTDNHRFIDSEGGGFQGKVKAVKIWKKFFRKYPEYRNVFSRVKSNNNLAIMIGRSICSNSKLQGKGIWVAKIKDGMVEEWRVYNDTRTNRSILKI